MKPFRRGDSALWLCMGWWELLNQFNPDPPPMLLHYDDRCQLWAFNDVPILMIYRHKIAKDYAPQAFVTKYRRFDHLLIGREWVLWLNGDDGVVKGFRGDGAKAVQDLTMMRLHIPGRSAGRS